MNGQNEYGYIIQRAWELMSTEFTINGFTISYAQVFLFHVICLLVLRAIFVYLILKG